MALVTHTGQGSCEGQAGESSESSINRLIVYQCAHDRAKRIVLNARGEKN